MENSEMIAACFRAVLLRAPSEEERRAFESEMRNGLALDGLIERLLLSLEFREGARASAEFVPAGHFYSVIPSGQARAEAAQNWTARSARRELPGIALNEMAMEAHFERIIAERGRFSFPAQKTDGWRYHYDNPAYAYADGLSLSAMIRHLRPKRIIEVGSGYSSALMLDVNEREFDHGIELTFIEPYPELLRSLFRGQDRVQVKVHAAPVQTIDVAFFDVLEANDILFIDSTHVAKLGSDVNFLFFEVLPRLRPGVMVHIHDIFWPFDYPMPWIDEGRAWNEAYLLRAFLIQNSRWKTVYFSDYFHLRRFDWLKENVPLLAENGGGHIWMQNGHPG